MVGTEAMIKTDNKRPLEFTTWSEEGSTTDPIYQGFVDRYAESYQLELEHFLDVLEGKTNVLSNFSCRGLAFYITFLG